MGPSEALPPVDELKHVLRRRTRIYSARGPAYVFVSCIDMIGRRFIQDFHRSRPWHVVHSCLGHVRRLRGWTRQDLAGQRPLRHLGDHAVYAHYDREGVIHDYVVHQVRHCDAGFRVISSQMHPPDEATMAAVRPSAAGHLAPQCRLRFRRLQGRHCGDRRSAHAIGWC